MPNRLKNSYTDTTMWASNIIIKELYLLKNHASNFLLSLNEKQKHNLGALSNSHVNFSPKDEVRRLKEFAVLVDQSCLTLSNPMDCSLPGSSIHGISETKILGWVAISLSRRSFWPRDRTYISYIGRQIFFTTESPEKL